MAKAIVALYDDPKTAQRVAYDLYHVGVQRDHVQLITGRLSDENLEWFERSWIEERHDTYQRHLEKGGALLIAWVMNVFKKDAKTVFDQYKNADLTEVKGRRWVGFNSTRT